MVLQFGFGLSHKDLGVKGLIPHLALFVGGGNFKRLGGKYSGH
jgi:hypothetical protein